MEMEPCNKEAKRELEKLRIAASSREESKRNTERLPNDRLNKQETDIPPLETVGRVGEQRGSKQGNVNKREGGGKKLKIVEVNSSQEKRVPAIANQIFPIEKPPHLRSKKPMRRIAVVDVASREDMNKKPVVVTSEAGGGSGSGSSSSVGSSSGSGGGSSGSVSSGGSASSSSGSGGQGKAVKTSSPPKAAVSLSSKATAAPTVPRTSHQFSQDWRRVCDQTEAAADYLKMIPSAFFRHVDLESNTMVEVARVLGGPDVTPTLAATHLTALTVSPGFTISLMFLDDDQKQGDIDDRGTSFP
ncbi:hypothetical protein GWK47_046996 [Chionoecetes opilio]|uniref:RNA-polymerase II-associated protein 3-like C-terminal domain-containing protein n=1 Tax=Chionoecetes opilio TaxID=41210 RepID=A0A8J4YE32_CHIOP|nr:hypothetical protein GWK47_046996 [Chionoecetes opilio]